MSKHIERYVAKKNGKPNIVEHEENGWKELKTIVLSIIGVLVMIAGILPLYTYAKGLNRGAVQQQIWIEQFPSMKTTDSVLTVKSDNHEYRICSIEKEVGKIDSMNVNISVIKAILLKK